MTLYRSAYAEVSRRSFSVLFLAAGLAGFHTSSGAQETAANPTSQENTMTNIDIAKTYIKAVQTGDQTTLGSIISPDVVWHQPGNNRFSGVLSV